MDVEKKRCTAVVLAAGSGRRMHTATAKQFMELKGKPLIWYSLYAVEHSEIIDDCILVTGEADIPYVRQEIVGKYGFGKVTDVIAGGDERYASVCNAMRYIAEGRQAVPNEDGYVFIHDGARPFLTEEILRNTYEAVRQYGACVAAVPSKDTIKIADEQGFAVSTPDRRLVWNIQTPQVFETELITAAYRKLERELIRLNGQSVNGQSQNRNDADGQSGDRQKPDGQGFAVTDDASVVELFTSHKVKLTMGSYENIKITTPEDISTAEGFLENNNYRTKTERNREMNKVYWAGDSTVQTNDYTTYPQNGIGQVFPFFLKEEYAVENHAKNGRSTKSFMDEGRLAVIEERIGEGDFLFIQFGHNDEKIKDPTRYTEPFGSFKENLKTYIKVARDHKAYPVLITPLERRCYVEEHKLGPGEHGDYVAGMKQVAEECDVPLVDLNAMSRAALEEAGEVASRKWHMYFEAGEYPQHPEESHDNTHLRYEGAVKYSSLIAKGLQEIGGIYGEMILEGI